MEGAVSTAMPSFQLNASLLMQATTRSKARERDEEGSSDKS